MCKYFDLNIEQVLEHWEMEHAIREIISNALDEQLLSDTQEIKIFKKNDKWYIRDYGRGLQYTHCTKLLRSGFSISSACNFKLLERAVFLFVEIL